MQSCRDALPSIGEWSRHAGHAGLMLDRYLPVDVDDSQHPRYRRELFAAAQSAMRRARPIYSKAFDRWKRALPQPVCAKSLSVKGRLIVGLGAENVLETGITLHRTYGVPIIPGSALKGLAAHYCDRAWDTADQEFRKITTYREDGEEKTRPGRYFTELFGTTADAGHIVFHDAWITPESLEGNNSGLVLDVITPHHADYYSGKTFDTGPRAGQLMPPTDFDDPRPIAFLSVTGTFVIAVSCDVPDDEGQKWAELAFELLAEALREWGVGGKTSSGYGRLIERQETDSGGPQIRPGTTTSQPDDQPGPARPRYRRGDKVAVKRVADSARGKPRFQTDDGFIGHFAGEDPPSVDLGGAVEVWIANVSSQGYTLTMQEPKKRQKRRPGR
ncbi:MAG: type III-B CRISPR module RAMP protein Cmr6 [Planctomycetes bacterium]|nr:type III-B CRISPR module RAMP protein Cmr6 [Planctomycetota bacterium]